MNFSFATRLVELHGKNFIAWFLVFTFLAAAIAPLTLAGTSKKRSLSKIDSAPDIWLLSLPDYPNVEMHTFIASGESAATGPEGLAHFLEHLVALQMNGIAANLDPPAELGAFTSRNDTLYSSIVSSPGFSERDLTEFLKLRFAPFAELTSAAGVASKEKQIIKHEYDQSVTGNPTRQINEFIDSVLFKGDGRSRAVVGTPSSIEKLSVKAAKQFHQREYVFGKSRILIIGDLKEQDIGVALKASESPAHNREPSEGSGDRNNMQATAFKACQAVAIKSIPSSRPPEIRLRRRLAKPDHGSKDKETAVATVLSSVLSQPVPAASGTAFTRRVFWPSNSLLVSVESGTSFCSLFLPLPSKPRIPAIFTKPS